MRAIKIGGDMNKEEVKILMGRYFSNSNVNILEEDYNDRFEFSFSFGKKKDFDDIAVYNTITNMIFDIIFEIYFKELMKERIAKICIEYSTEEKEKILSLTYENTKSKKNFIREKTIIKEEILNHLIENNTLILDGFMHFRLRRFIYILDISIEKAISEIETEKEYLEFVNMLQYFVEIQESKEELINVIIKGDNYLLLDKDNKPIENGLLNVMDEDLWNEDMSKGDLLVSSLIVLSPLKLIVHIEENKEKDLIDILSKVFKDKITICNNCNICELKQKDRREKKNY